MNKRITSLALVFTLILTLLATAVPALAAPSDPLCTFTVEADKTSANPGEEITITLYLQQKSTIVGYGLFFDVQSGLTYVEDSGVVPSELSSTMGFLPDWVPENSLQLTGFSASASDFSGTEKLKQISIKCTVADDAVVGSTLTVTLKDIEVGGGSTLDYDMLTDEQISVIPATITVTAAPKPATGISLNKSTLKLTVGESETLVATVEPADTTDTVTWDTGRSDLATVDSTGKVTAVAPGTAVIAARAGEKSAFCTVTVVAAPCTHTNKTPVSAKSSTCKVQGWDAYSKCNDCGQLFDKNGNEIDAVPTRSLAAHTAQHHARVEPTHAAAGNIEYWTCSVCNKYFSDAACTAEITQEQTVLNKIEHSFGSDWKSNADQHWHECSCGEKNAIANHTFEWKTDTAATEDATGLKHEECTDCHYKRNENTVIPKLEHTHAWQETPAKASTCTEQGNNQYFYCTKCEKYFKANKVTETTVAAETLPLASHTESSWKSDANGHWKECTECGAITTEKVAHTPDREAATETDPIKCSVCDYVITPALGLQEYTIDLPFSLAVKLTGDEKPAKETFKFEIYDLGVEDAKFEIVKDGITVENLEFDENGVAFIEGSLKIKVTGKEQLSNLTEGFSVRMVKGSTKGWTYASEQWRIEPFFENDALDLKIAVKEIIDGEISEVYANGMSFSVGYEAVTEPETPQTGDSSMMVLWIALFVVSGAGATAIYSRKRKSSAK